MVQSCKPCLKDYKYGVHKAVILDDIDSPAFVVANKKLLQAHVDGAKLGQSPTQRLTYHVWLWRVPVIVTTNAWNLAGFKEKDVDWLEENCIVHEVLEKVA